MFHELGHAVLGRFHANNKLANGLERSMMCGEPNDCNQFALYNEYMPALREYYIDELFEPLLDPPAWAMAKMDTSLLIDDNFELENTGWLFSESRVTSAGNFTGTYDSLESQGLRIKSSSRVIQEQWASWRYESSFGGALEETNMLRLRVKLSSEGLLGSGAGIALRTDSGGNDFPSAFSTTQGDILITGDQESAAYEIVIPYVPSEVHVVKVFLMLLPETVGSVTFEEVELQLLK